MRFDNHGKPLLKADGKPSSKEDSEMVVQEGDPNNYLRKSFDRKLLCKGGKIHKGSMFKKGRFANPPEMSVGGKNPADKRDSVN